MTAVNLNNLFDTWDSFEHASKENETISFDFDPLVITCAMIRKGHEPFNILAHLSLQDKDLTDRTFTDEDLELANTIRKYFSQKHMMRRIKGDFISEWMKKVDALCENSREVKKDLVKVIVTLPRIYESNLFSDKLVKRYNSVPSRKNAPNFESELTFVSKQFKKSSRESNTFTYYWHTSDNFLVSTDIYSADTSSVAWDAIAKIGTVRAKFKDPHVRRLRGYDFNMYQINNDTEILI